MILANLLHRPIRSLISVIAIMVEVTLILVIVGLSLGILNDTKHRQAGIGADVIVQPPGSSFMAGITGAPVSIKVAEVLRKMPHVLTVSPVIYQLSTSKNVEVIYGIDPATFEQLGGPFHFISGGPFTGPNQVIVDDFLAASEHLKSGDTIEILNHPFQISGIVPNGRGARKFLPIHTMQELIGAQDKASVFYVKLDTPDNADQLAKQIHRVNGMQQYRALSMREYLSLMTPGNLPGFQQFIEVVIGVSVIIGFIVIFQAMYTAVMERTREIGILKSLGASKFYIVNVMLRETLLLAITGTIVGIGASYLTKNAIRARFPTLVVEIQPDWIVYATIIAITGAILGAIYPAFKAAQKDPIDALAYE